MVDVASNLEGLSVSKASFDQNTRLLNLLNGTLDLKTGELRPHSAEDMITKVAGCSFNPNGEAPRFKQFIKEIINVSNKGVATSGDYKNFFDNDGKKYSHIINPKSGMPINHSTKSVTVIEESAMLADGWATAFLAMGSVQGLKIAEKEKIAVIFIDKSEKKLIKITSNEFKKLK